MKKKGFTFLETLVVISIFSLIFPLVLSILLVILNQQFRVYGLTEVKRQGDSIVNLLEGAISNHAYRIYDVEANEICQPTAPAYPISGLPSTFRDQYNSEFFINWSEPELSLVYDPPLAPAPTFAFKQGLLNNSKVRITNFSLTCEKLALFSAPIINISFTACYNLNDSCLSSDVKKMVSLDYQSRIKLRSYPTQ